MSDTFSVRLLDEGRFVYFDHDEAQSGDVEREVTADWSDHDLEDLDRVMTMLETLGHHFEVRGLTWVADMLAPSGGRWSVNPKDRTASSPAAIASGGHRG